MSVYQSPISPGVSWYEASIESRPNYPQLDGDEHADVAIVGGGYCGLSAALHLARTGVSVVLLEAHRLGDGASGRNGGQMGSGQHKGVAELEQELGFERSKALWDMAEDAKENLLSTADLYGIDCDYQQGQISVLHRRRYEVEAQAEIEVRRRVGYTRIEWLDRAQTAAALGSQFYHSGWRDTGTGHIHPMKYLVGLGQAAASESAKIYEQSAVTAIKRGSKTRLETRFGSVTADRVLLAMNAYHGDIDDTLAKHVMPLRSFIGATQPLPQDTTVLPGGESVDDSRFVVRYFRKSRDNRLLFGGREAYSSSSPGNIEAGIRRQIAQIYPDLRDIEITHAWGGSVGITMPRMPFVRELAPNLWTAGGFSGHGVLLSNQTGRLIAQHFLGRNDQIKLLQELDIPAFPGGKLFRNPLKVLALTWYAMLDRI